ncbi:MAG TPA: hypothetical protein VK943_07250, partial [Arenibaculum sp.]|nr:hypothetical protein [Arenibaculum sp.]
MLGRTEILPGAPVPALNAVGGPAFFARSQRDRKVELFAIVCNGGLPPRLDILGALRGAEHSSLM